MERPRVHPNKNTAFRPGPEHNRRSMKTLTETSGVGSGSQSQRFGPKHSGSGAKRWGAGGGGTKPSGFVAKQTWL